MTMLSTGTGQVLRIAPDLAGAPARTPTDRVTVNAFAEIQARAHAIAWISILAGALSGMVMGLWSFDGPFPVPEWIGAYDSLPRRFLRLAHVAMFALGGLHILLANQLSGSSLPDAHRRTAYRAMAAGNILMPVILIAAAVWEPFKYLTALPAALLTIAMGLTAQDAVRKLGRTRT